jgi:hypothetical protein
MNHKKSHKLLKTPIIPPKEHIYLEGPKSRGYELWFALRVLRQFIRGFRALHFMGPSVTVFGSARFPEGHVYYEKAREFGRRIAHLGLVTITGGGPGVMEAANRGAFEAGGQSVGCNILLPFEQKENPYLHKSITFEHFFVRKVLLVKYSYAFIIMPGGFGTMDELFETLTLVQTKTITKFPIVLFGKQYYQPLMDAIQDMEKQGTISPEDLSLVKFTDDVEEAMEFIAAYIKKHYQVKPRKRLWWLLEKR